MNEYGVITEPGTIRFERVFPGPIERVWAYVTESEKRGKWFASGVWDLRVGGKVELIFKHSELSSEKAYPEKHKNKEAGMRMEGQITRCDPPRLLAYTWFGVMAGNSEVIFELAPRGKDVLFTLTHRRLDRPTLLGVSGGWHTHLGILEDNLRGVAPRPFWTTHAKLEAEYLERMPPA